MLILIQPFEHHAIWLENILELSKNVDAPTDWREWAIWVYSGSNPENLRNHEVQTHEKRITSVLL
jgi:hypothetical protein